MEKYDSKNDTIKHKERIKELIMIVCKELIKRSIKHDDSKLEDFEKKYFDKYTPVLKKLSYGKEDYKKSLEKLSVALKHHYKNNSHHPEHYKNGIDDMDLFDVFEMLMDWKASSERHEDGDIKESLKINKKRFNMANQLYNVLLNTIQNMDLE